MRTATPKPTTRPIEEVSTITAKGQTTVPKSVRRALGVDAGGKIAFRVENGRVTVQSVEREKEHEDPAIGAFLKLLEKDIATGNVLSELPKEVLAAMRRVRKFAPVDLDEYLEGDVDI